MKLPLIECSYDLQQITTIVVERVKNLFIYCQYNISKFVWLTPKFRKFS